MTDERTPALLAGIVEQLARIADALEAQAIALAPSQPLPDLVRPLADFPTFNWHSIDATVIEMDQYGPTLVEYRGKTYKRRSPENKFGAAIWFSRSVGKDEEGQNQYEKFITFKEMAPAEPLSRAAEAKTSASKPAGNGHPPQPQPATKAPPQPDTARQADQEARCHVCGQTLPHHAPSCSVGKDERARAAKAEEDAARAAFLASQEAGKVALQNQQSDADFAGMKSASHEPEQAAALKAAAASRPAPVHRPVWSGPDAAKAWALEQVDPQGAPVFANAAVVEATYNRVKADYTSREKNPTPAGFFDAWYAEVEDRKESIPF